MENCECSFCKSKRQKIVYDQSKLRVVKCKDCGLVFQCPVILNELKQYYKERPKTIEMANTFRRRRMESIVERLNNMIKGADRLLDVGCGWGYFMNLMRKEFPKVEGVEPNKDQADYLKEEGFNIHQTVYSDSLFDENVFDVITFIQVLEHVGDPLKTVKASYRHLKKDGILVIDVPSYNNPRFLIYRFFKIKAVVQKDFIAPHLFYYTPSTLKAICEKAGFDILHSDIGQYSIKLGKQNTFIGNLMDKISNFLQVGSITIYAKK